MSNRFRFNCPHCECQSKVTGSRYITPTFKEIRLACLNSECGHTYVAEVSISRTISTSACPNPNIRLPIAAQRAPMRRLLPGPRPANDPFPLAPAANDEGFGAAVEA